MSGILVCSAFNSDRITRAIFLAASKVAEKENSSADYSVSEKITQDVISLLNSKYANSIPGVEDIQDVVVKVLIEKGHAKTSEEYDIF